MTEENFFQGFQFNGIYRRKLVFNGVGLFFFSLFRNVVIAD